MDEMTDEDRKNIEEEASGKKVVDKKNATKILAERDPWKDAKKESAKKPEKNNEKKPEKNGEKPKKGLSGVLGVVRDVAVSAGIVVIILVSLFAYTGVWPPMVVIESNSMMHGGDGQIGVIDTGDLTLVKSIKDRHDVVTYVEATCATDPHHGFKTYGDFGNVIIYRKNGLAETPVIHRAIAWIEYNASASNSPSSYRGDIADIHVFNVDQYTFYGVGYQNQSITISLQRIFASSATSTSRAPHSGFVTHGDHNPNKVDQESLSVQKGGMVEPVKASWVVGRAEGELPWFGLFKLWITGHNAATFPESSKNGLITTVFLLIAVPITVDFAISWNKKRKENRKELRERVRKRTLK